MSNNNLDYNAERYCPVYNEIIGDGLCYDTIMCMTKQIKVSSLPELNNVKDIQKARDVCEKCPYSDLS